MASKPTRLSLEVERFLLGQLSPEREARLRARLGDAQLAELERMHAEQSAELFERLPPAHFQKLVEARARTQERSRAVRKAPWLVPALVVGLAAAFVAVALPEREPGTAPKDALEDTRAKGLAPTLLVFRRQAGGVEELAPLSQVAPSDVLQLGYVAAGRPYGVIVSLDGAGAVTLHSPAQERATPLLEPAGKHMLESAYQLDAAPHFERFVLVTSETPFDLATVLRAASEKAKQADAREGPLALPSGLEQTSFVLRKAAP
jgi:hypothetical protein